MSTNVLVLGFDARPAEHFARLRASGYYVEMCVIDTGATAEEVTRLQLDSRTFDCVLFGAELRTPDHLRLFEKLVNLVHARAPLAKLCFDVDGSDCAETIERWA